MKRLIQIIFLWLAAFSLNAQNNCSVGIGIDSTNTGDVLLVAYPTGDAPFAFEWSSGENTQSILWQQPGVNYCVTVTDASGCSASECLYNNNFCEVWIAMDSVGNNVELTATPTGTAPFAYTWTTGETTASVIWNPNGALYCVTVTDATGCEASSCFGTPVFCSVQISENPAGGLSAIPNGTAPYNFVWNNGQTDQTIFPNAPGTYCVTMATADGCTTTACYQYTGGGGNDSCSVYIALNFDSLPPGTNTWVMTAIANGEAPFSYQWNVQNASSPSISVSSSGMYCVTVTSADGCVASDCFFLNLNNCSVNIVQEDSAGVDYLIADAIGNQFSFLWNTGETSPVITPATAGMYCVTVTNSNGCQSSDCLFYDPLSGSYPFVIQGYVYLPDSINANALDGFAELYQFDANGSLSLIATTDLVTDPGGWSNYYSFGVVPAGQYLVKINVDANSPQYDEYVATYYGNVELWNEATIINVPCNCNAPLYNVIMIEDENFTGGSGQITGTVTEAEGLTHGGDNRGAGDPLEGVSILLYNSFDQLIGHTITDANGAFTFDNLPFGTYKLMVEITGIEQAERSVTLSTDEPVSSGNDFEVTEEGIVNGLSELIFESSFRLSPNPSTDLVNVYLETTASFEAQLSLSSVTGQVVLAKTQNLVAGKQAVQFELSDLPTGIYFLQVSTGREVMVQKLVKE